MTKKEKYNIKVETYPQIVIKENGTMKYIGGYQELRELEKKGELINFLK